MRPISEIAAEMGLSSELLIPYGSDKAKVKLGAIAQGSRRARLVLVSAITPTDAGEGKTTTSIGLAQGFAQLGERAALALREPSLGPTFGAKGGATGGGRARLEPSEEIDLHFTGDFHAVSTAHNLLAAMLDNHISSGNALDIDPRRVMWRRVIDLNDRALRHVIIGLGGVLEGVPRETGFDITPASEVMAALCLAESPDDLRARLARMIVGLTFARSPVTAADLKAVGAMMVLLKDALLPNLVQSGEGVPAFVHGGPFANIAHGCNSVLATKMACAWADWAVTEAGFGVDLGAEKFFDIKCVSAGLDPSAVVLVATVRALKRHGGAAKAALAFPDPASVERGIPNLEKHVEIIRSFGVPAVIALNRFASDSDDEIAVVRDACRRSNLPFAVSEVFARGGPGGTELATLVRQAASGKHVPFRPLYAWSDPIREKIDRIARGIYGARVVRYTKEADRDIALAEKLGEAGLAICMAKTPMSLSDDPARAGRPENFEITVRNVLIAAGAGYLIPIVGDILRMPGLPSSPQAEKIDLVDGRVVGLR